MWPNIAARQPEPEEILLTVAFHFCVQDYLDRSDKRAVAEYDVPADLPIFAGHFPGIPSFRES